MLMPMIDRDILRFKVLTDLRKHRLSQVDDAKILNITLHQIRRFLDKLSMYGAHELTHAARRGPLRNKSTILFLGTILIISNVSFCSH